MHQEPDGSQRFQRRGMLRFKLKISQLQYIPNTADIQSVFALTMALNMDVMTLRNSVKKEAFKLRLRSYIPLSRMEWLKELTERS